jgi:hypothetical protein
VLALAALGLGAPVLSATTAGAASGPVEDIDAPVLTSIDAPASVDATADHAVAHLVLHTEDLSGVEIAAVSMTATSAPAGGAFTRVDGSTFVPEGTPPSDPIAVDVLIPRYAWSGTWCVSQVSLWDRVDNRSDEDAADLGTRGACVEVLSTPDHTPPQLSAPTMSPATAPNTAAVPLSIDLPVTDDVSGATGLVVSMVGPTSRVNLDVQADGPTTGTPLSGSYHVELTLPAGIQPGKWCISASISDGAGNGIQYEPDTGPLAGRCVQVTGTRDTTDTDGPELVPPPSLTPSAVDVAGGSTTVVLEVHATDARAGLGQVQADLVSSAAPTDPLGRSAGFAIAPTSGTAADGTYRIEIPLPQHAISGPWCLSGLSLFDRLGNGTQLGAAELGSLCTTVTSAGDVEPPTIASVSTIAPPVVDTTSGPRQIAFDVHATDDTSGLSGLAATLESRDSHSASSQQTVEVQARPEPVGTTDGTVHLVATIPQWSRLGRWCIDSLTATDLAGRTTLLRRGEGPINGVCFTVGSVPVVHDQAVSTRVDVPAPIVLDATDLYGNPLSFALGMPGHGSVAGAGPNVTYTPAAGYVGDDSFTYTATDQSGHSATATVTVQVLAREATQLTAVPGIQIGLGGLKVFRRLEARLTDAAGAPLPGLPVVFQTGAFACVGTTDANGVAGCSLTLNGVLAFVGQLSYDATFLGTADLAPSTSHAGLLKLG